MSIFHQAVSPECLERHLHELNGIFVVHLVEVKLVQLKQLVTLNVLDLLGATYVGHFGDGVRKFKVDEGVHSIQNALRIHILLLVDRLHVLCSGCFR